MQRKSSGGRLVFSFNGTRFTRLNWGKQQKTIWESLFVTQNTFELIPEEHKLFKSSICSVL